MSAEVVAGVWVEAEAAGRFVEVWVEVEGQAEVWVVVWVEAGGLSFVEAAVGSGQSVP